MNAGSFLYFRLCLVRCIGSVLGDKKDGQQKKIRTFGFPDSNRSDGASGCELALSLLGEGKEVTILEMTDRLAGAGNLLYWAALGEQLAKYPRFHVVYHAGVREITSDAVVYRLSGEDMDRDRDFRLAVDDVVLCVGLIPRSEEAMQFLPLGYDVRMVGDCVAPRRINEAVQEGYFAGRYMM